MFEPFDEETEFAAAAGVTTESIRDSLKGYIDAGILSETDSDAICKDIGELLRIIGDEKLKGEKFWEVFQGQFGFAHAFPRITPMNAANLCPEPTALIKAANRLRVAYNNNVAQQLRTAGGLRVKQIQEVRASLARGLGLRDPSDLAIIRNSSEGNNAVSCGYRDWRETNNIADLDKVVVWAENHPTNLEAWRLRRDWKARTPRSGDEARPGDPFRLQQVTFAYDASEAAIIEAFTSKIDDKTRFVSYSETSNGSGFRIPERVIKAIWNHIEKHRYNCHVHIDGTMTWGARDVNLAIPCCHSFVSSAHKWFMGPKETAILYMAKDKAKNFAPSIFAYDYKIEVGPWPKMPESALRFELLGQRDDVNLIILRLTQLIWTKLAPRNPSQRVVKLASLLKKRLTDHKRPWTLITPLPKERSSGVVRVAAPAKDPKNTLYDWLYKTAGIKTAGISGSGDAKTFRLCPHIYNTKQDVEYAFQRMNDWREKHGA